MLRHIVMWKFRPGTEAERDLFLTGLQGLYGAIPELKSCQVLRGMEGSDYDAVLISEFADQAALEAYKNDPRHKAVSALCKSIRTEQNTAEQKALCANYVYRAPFCHIFVDRLPKSGTLKAQKNAFRGRIRQWPFIRKQKPTTPRPTWA